ncbi:MAG: hypothetical protein Q4B80_05995 [Aerococcaceae bacterium]|nr:hypothetical protein [Aerococcaceae bacterium]
MFNKRFVNYLLCVIACLLPAQAVFASSLADYAPFIHKKAQFYQGDGQFYYQRNMILEFKPDANGIYQVTSYNQANEASAYVYQLNDDGLYELAVFPQYHEVQDLRYSAEAQDAVKSIVLPTELTADVTYSSGYQQEFKRTIVGVIDTCTIDNHHYQNVLVVKQESDSGTLMYYFAPQTGLILTTDEQGNPLEILIEK